MPNYIKNYEDNNSFKKEAAKRSTLVSVLVNIILGVSQVSVGIFSGSSGLVAELIHSFSDFI